MKDIVKLVAGRAVTAGGALIALSLILQHIEGSVPHCMSAACLAVGAVLIIFSLGKVSA